jgi:hypothetical protein
LRVGVSDGYRVSVSTVMVTVEEYIMYIPYSPRMTWPPEY